MNFMLMAPLVLVGLLSFAVLRLLRGILAIPLPSSLVYQPTRQFSEVFASLHAQQEQVLLGLGFTRVLTSHIRFEPANLPCPNYVRFYLDPIQTVLIQVADPVSLAEVTTLRLSIWSRFKDGSILTTRPTTKFSLFWREIFASPKRFLHLSLSAEISLMLREHREILDKISKEKGSPQPWESGEGLASTMADLFNGTTIEQIQAGRVVAASDGSLRISWCLAVSLLLKYAHFWNLLRAIDKNDSREVWEKLPLEMGPYFYRFWQGQQYFQPTLAAQVGIVGVNALIFLGILLTLAGPIFAAMGFGVLLLYELGRYLALWSISNHRWGFSLIPLLGGGVSYFPERLSSWQQILVNLLGPLPGILLGWGLLYAVQPSGSTVDVFLGNFAFLLLLVNYFNLLPLFPLDGGQILRALIPARVAILWVSFELAFALCLLFLAWFLQSSLLVVLGGVQWFLALRHLGISHQLKEWGMALDERMAKLDYANATHLTDQAFQLYHQYFPQSKRRNMHRRMVGVYTALLYWRREAVGPVMAVLGVSGYFLLFAVPIGILSYGPTHWRFLVQPDIWDAKEIAIQEKTIQGFTYQELLVSLLYNKAGFQCRNNAVTDATVSEGIGPPVRLRPPASEEEIVAIENTLRLRFPKDYRSLVMVSNGLPSPQDEAVSFLLPVQRVFPLAEANPTFSRGYSRLTKAVPLAGRAVNDNTAQSVALERLNKMLLIGYLPGSADPILLDVESSWAGAPWTVYVLVINENGRMLLPYPSLRYFLEEEQMNGWMCVETERRIAQRSQSRQKDPLVRAFFTAKEFILSRGD